jgi:hypothetical protein
VGVSFEEPGKTKRKKVKTPKQKKPLVKLKLLNQEDSSWSWTRNEILCKKDHQESQKSAQDSVEAKCCVNYLSMLKITTSASA